MVILAEEAHSGRERNPSAPHRAGLGYTVVVIIAAIVLFMVIELVAGISMSAPRGFGR
jgi:hypothetical protein